MRKYNFKDSSYWQFKNGKHRRKKKFKCDYCSDRVVGPFFNVILERFGGRKRSMLVDYGCLLYFKKYFSLTQNQASVKVFNRSGEIRGVHNS